GPTRLAMSAAGPRLIGADALWTLPRGSSRWSERKLRWPAGESGEGFSFSAATIDGKSVYLARAGGPLIRLDATLGRAAALPGRTVAALVPDPKSPACVLVAYAGVGGTLARACGDQIQPIVPPPDDPPEPFVAVAADGEVIWAVGRTALWRIAAG